MTYLYRGITQSQMSRVLVVLLYSLLLLLTTSNVGAVHREENKAQKNDVMQWKQEKQPRKSEHQQQESHSNNDNKPIRQLRKGYFPENHNNPQETQQVRKHANLLLINSNTNSTYNNNSTAAQQRLIGSYTVHEGQYPWFVELIARDYDGKFPRRCAGVMLSGNALVTLAECAYDARGVLANLLKSSAIIKRQEIKRGKGVYRNWKAVKIHPDFVLGQAVNNVAVIRLDQQPLFPEDDINDLNGDENVPPRFATMTALGYGSTDPWDPHALSSKLQAAEFIKDSNKGYCPGFGSDDFICVRTDYGQDLCPGGDRGAPLLWGQDRILYGLWVAGGSCRGDIPDSGAVFLRIFSYRSWIFSAACEIAQARCASAPCFLGIGGGDENDDEGSSLVGRMAHAVSRTWQWMTAPSSRKSEGDIEGGGE